MPGVGTQATRSEARPPAVPPDDGDEHRLRVPGRADQVLRARAFIARALAARGLDAETACLLGSELVTNSVLHSDSRLPGGAITVTVALIADEIHVEVADDGGAGQPVVGDGANPCAEHGRGLLLVAALSARWGYRRGPGVLTTWFQVPAEPARPSLVRAERERFMPIHPPEPAAGSFRASDGQRADLFNVRHYPVHATCQLCGEEITADNFFRPFEHISDVL